MPTIYWLCPKPDSPSGGVWFIHRLAQLCDQYGLPAHVVQVSPEPFDVWWDANPVARRIPLFGPQVQKHPIVHGDTLVVPEVLWDIGFDTRERKILFIQNYIWIGQETRARIRIQKPEILVCSRYLYNWCERELGIKPIGIVTPYLDPDVWAKEDKVTDSVLLFSRRNPEMADALYREITAAGFDVHLQRDPVSQREIRELLNHREFYVHHVEPEGFPMADLEAMRCGTIPVGTTGGGGNEFMFNDETAMVTPGPTLGLYSDPQIFVNRVLAMLRHLREAPEQRSRMWQKGVEWSLRYNAQATAAQLTKIFSPRS